MEGHVIAAVPIRSGLAAASARSERGASAELADRDRKLAPN
jgi:hypothetical protein